MLNALRDERDLWKDRAKIAQELVAAEGFRLTYHAKGVRLQDKHDVEENEKFPDAKSPLDDAIMP